MIAILGVGDFGLAMGHAVARTGRPFCFGARTPGAVAESVETLKRQGALKTCVGVCSIEAAIAAAELVILAVPYSAAAPLVQRIADWAGKTLVDCTNPLKAGLTGLEVGHNNSAAEEVARHANNAKVVKAFSTLSAYVLEHPTFGTGRAFMPVCGDDADARAGVIELGRLMGFDVVDIGPLLHARYIEPYAMLGIQLAVQRRYGHGFALGVLQRDPVTVAPPQTETPIKRD